MKVDDFTHAWKKGDHNEQNLIDISISVIH